MTRYENGPNPTFGPTFDHVGGLVTELTFQEPHMNFESLDVKWYEQAVMFQAEPEITLNISY